MWHKNNLNFVLFKTNWSNVITVWNWMNINKSCLINIISISTLSPDNSLVLMLLKWVKNYHHVIGNAQKTLKKTVLSWTLPKISQNNKPRKKLCTWYTFIMASKAFCNGSSVPKKKKKNVLTYILCLKVILAFINFRLCIEFHRILTEKNSVRQDL